MNTSIKKFIQNVSEINDPDYGDFMRKANHYLLELEKEITKKSNERILDYLSQMKKEIQFSPNWDIGTTRQKIILEARMIDHELAEEFDPLTPMQMQGSF